MFFCSQYLDNNLTELLCEFSNLRRNFTDIATFYFNVWQLFNG